MSTFQDTGEMCKISHVAHPARFTVIMATDKCCRLLLCLVFLVAESGCFEAAREKVGSAPDHVPSLTTLTTRKVLRACQE